MASLPGCLQGVGTSQDVWTPVSGAHSLGSAEGWPYELPPHPVPPPSRILDHPENVDSDPKPRHGGGGGGGHASCRGSSPSSTDRPPCGARAFPASGTFAALPLAPGRQLVPCFPFSRRSTGNTDWAVGHLDGRTLQERPLCLAGWTATGMGSRSPASSAARASALKGSHTPSLLGPEQRPRHPAECSRPWRTYKPPLCCGLPP